MHNFLRMTVIESISDGLDDLDDLVLILAFVSVFWFAKLASLHVFHHNVEVVCIVVNLIHFDDVRMFKPEEDFAFIQEDSDVLFADSFLVNDFYCIFIKILAKNRFSHFCERSLSEEFLENVEFFNWFGGNEI